MTEPKVEAGDRALETARKIRGMFGDGDNCAICKATVAKIAALIQSAMNPPERVCNFAEHLEPELLRLKLSAMNAHDKARLGTDWQELAEQNQKTALKALALVDAMNAQERELREALKNLVDSARRHKNGWMGAAVLDEHLAEAERLLAERGGTP